MNEELKMELEELEDMLLEDASRVAEQAAYKTYDNADCARILRNVAADLDDIIHRFSP